MNELRTILGQDLPRLADDTERLNKRQRDTLWKQPVRVATTANGTLATAFDDASSVDGVTLAEGDRILLKDQTAGAVNGIYNVQKSGAPVRSEDSDVNEEMRSGVQVAVEEGTTNKGRVYMLTTFNPIVVGTTVLTFTQVGP